MEATDMNVVRSALTANNVAGLPNKRDYIHKERDRLMEERRQRILATTMPNDDHLTTSNVSLDMQDVIMEEYDSPTEEDMDDDDEAINAIPQSIQANLQLAHIENRNEDALNEQNRRNHIQVRSQRFGSQHEIRRRA